MHCDELPVYLQSAQCQNLFQQSQQGSAPCHCSCRPTCPSCPPLQDVYESFLGDNKLEALLHGHSYTAHATGCAAGVASLDLFTNPSKNPNYDPASHAMKEMWDAELVREMSFLPQVARVNALGTIFAVELRSETTGYGSLASRGIVLRLRKRGVYCRALGNVMYLMCTPMTQVDRCTQLLLTLKEEIERT